MVRINKNQLTKGHPDYLTDAQLLEIALTTLLNNVLKDTDTNNRIIDLRHRVSKTSEDLNNALEQW